QRTRAEDTTDAPSQGRLGARTSEMPTQSPSPQSLAFRLADIQTAYLVGRSEAFEFGGVGMHFYEEISLDRLDVKRLECAWQRVIERHEMLRSVASENGREQSI